MSSPAPWMELPQAWGLGDAAALQSLQSRVGAIRWWHQAEELDVPALPANALVFMLRNGASSLHRGGRLFRASSHAGGMGILPCGSESHWTFRGTHESVHLYLPAQFLAELAERDARSAPALREKLVLDDPFLGCLMSEVVEAMKEGDRSRVYLDTLGATIGARLLRNNSDASGPGLDRTLRSRGGLAPWQERRATEFLHAHLCEDVSLSQLAETAGLSTFHFARQFKQATGLPPHAYQRRLRCQMAQDLLASSDMSVGEIAAAVGYDTPQAFARMFRAQIGTSPGAYRRERRS